MPLTSPLNADLTLNELMETWPATIQVFLRHKMLCVGCLVTPFHTVEDACAEYHLDQHAFVAELHEAVMSAAHPGTSTQGGGDRSR